MKSIGKNLTALLLAMLLLFSALPLTVYADGSYQAPSHLRFSDVNHDPLKVEWDLDYSALSEDVSVLHTLTFYKDPFHNYVSYKSIKILELEIEGRVNEVDLTPYRDWYFSDGESRYHAELVTQYSIVENGTTYTTTMSTVKSNEQWLPGFAGPDPSVTDVNAAELHEGAGAVEVELSWENMQELCQLQFAFTVNDGDTTYFTVYPQDEDLPVNGSQHFSFAVKQMGVDLYEGDRVHCEIKVYRMVTMSGGFAVGEPTSFDLVIQPADPSAPKITGAVLSGVRAGASAIRMDVTWENMPLENCVLEIGISVNDGDPQYFEVTPEGENAVSDGTRSFELETSYLKKPLYEGDKVHVEFTFIRDSDGTALCLPYSADTTVKPKTVTEYKPTYTVIAVYAKTGEMKEYTVADGSSSEMYMQLLAMQAQAQAWLIEKGASQDSIAAGNMIVGADTYLLDGVEVSGQEYFSGSYDPDTKVIISEMRIYMIARESAVLGDVNRSGEVDITDVTWIQRSEASMEFPFTNEDYALGDVDQSGETNVMDATFIQKYLTEMKTPYKIGSEIE